MEKSVQSLIARRLKISRMQAVVTFEVQDDAMNLDGDAGGQCDGQDPNH
jgi:hypothetical protein